MHREGSCAPLMRAPESCGGVGTRFPSTAKTRHGRRGEKIALLAPERLMSGQLSQLTPTVILCFCQPAVQAPTFTAASGPAITFMPIQWSHYARQLGNSSGTFNSCITMFGIMTFPLDL